MFEKQETTPRRAVEAIFQETERLTQFVYLCRDSLALKLEVQHLALETKKDKGPNVDFKEWVGVVEKAEKIAGLALINTIDNSSYLFALATVRLWTGLESGIDDLVIALLERDARWKTLATIRTSHIRLGEFIALSPREQMTYLLHELLAETKARFQQGIGRFEAILSAVECGGEVSGDVRRTMLELAETRHLMAHRGGRPDATFTERCPWVPVWRGGIIRVRPVDFHRFTTAVIWYMCELMTRLQTRGWLDGPEEDWAANRDSILLRLQRMEAEPRPVATGAPQDLVMLFHDYEASRDLTGR